MLIRVLFYATSNDPRGMYSTGDLIGIIEFAEWCKDAKRAVTRQLRAGSRIVFEHEVTDNA